MFIQCIEFFRFPDDYNHEQHMSINGLEIKSLKGLSGCRLSLLKDDCGSYSVVKFSNSINYNQRLCAQYLKQIGFKKFNNINAPKVFDYGELNGLAYFRMEFIKGQTLADLLRYADIDQVLPILNDILCMLCKSKNKKNFMGDSLAAFRQKINSLRTSCKGLPYFSEVFSRLDRYDWSDIPNTDCHGDLTTENIIISGKEIYLIDFLDSFYDTWFIDIAKLLQDFELGWSFRGCKLSVELELKLSYCSNYIRDFVKQQVEFGARLSAIDAILLLNVCRIFPYAKDDITYNWIENKIRYLLD